MRMRILHTMLRVGDLERSLDFYTRILGMKLLRRQDYPEGKFTLAFVGYGPEDTHPALELTHNWDTSKYELGNAAEQVGADGPQARRTARTQGPQARAVAAGQGE